MKRTAIIVGGGIAGPLAAIGLKQAGVDVTLYEAYAQSAGLAAGAWLTVAVNGLAAMRSLGVHDAVKQQGFPSESIEFASGTGKLLGELPIGGRLADGTVTHTIKRSDLYRIMAEAAQREGIPMQYGKRLVEAQQVSDGIVAHFADGSEAHADVLIGADGVHSRTRHLIDAAAPVPRYTGLQNVGGFAPAGSCRLRPRSYRMIFGKRCFFGYTVAPSGEVWWFANPPSARELTRDELAEIDWRAHLLELFALDRGPMLELIRSTPGKLQGTNQYELSNVPAWQRGRMLILGDAAHAASPSSGQGASMAAEDALALALCMRAHADSPAALTAFVQARRARAEQVVAHGQRHSNMKTLGPVGRVLRDLMLPLMFRMQSRTSGSDSLAWLYDHRPDVTL